MRVGGLIKQHHNVIKLNLRNANIKIEKLNEP